MIRHQIYNVSITLILYLQSNTQYMIQNQFCGIQTYDNYRPAVLFMYATILLISLIGGLRLLLKWIQFKDYFPLKQRSPILCIILLFFLVLEVNIYPVLVIYSYFFNQHGNTFRIAYVGISFIPYFIYVIRSIRIIYAYKVHPKMRNSKIFRFFKNQWNFIIIILALWILKSIPPIVCPDSYILSIDPITHPNQETFYFISTISQELVWHLVLLVCLWQQRKIQPEFGIIRQIVAVLLISLIITFGGMFYTIFYVYKLKNQTVDQTIITINCYQNYPIRQYVKIFHDLVMIVISLVIPLFRIREYHTLLPIQQNYDIDNNLRTFLLEPLCYRVFYKFLQTIQTKQSTSQRSFDYLYLMKIWSKITRMKLQEEADADTLSNFIKDVSTQLFGTSIVQSLKKSIAMLNQSISEKQQLRQSINQTIQEIELIVIQKITKIYRDRFRRTCCYSKLKQIMQQNDNVNTNLLLLGMILREQLQIEE